jgi:putative ATP-dependent endonuclease of OLD family
VCAVHGTHFGSYVRLLSALRIPWAVITDGDPNAEGARVGVRRAALLLERLGSAAASPEEAGIFVGETTFEYDLFAAAEVNATAFFDALESLGPTAPAAAKLASWRDEGSPPAEELLSLVEGAGKGRLAHRLADTQLDAPEYVAAALRYLAADDERARAGT